MYVGEVQPVLKHGSGDHSWLYQCGVWIAVGATGFFQDCLAGPPGKNVYDSDMYSVH